MYKFVGNKLSIGEIWGSTLSFYRQTLAKIWSIALILALVTTFGVVLLKSLMPLRHYRNLLVHQLPSGLHLLLFIALTIVLVLIMFYLTAVILHRIYTLTESDSTSLRDSLVYVSAKYLIILASMLLIGCILGLPLLIAVLLVKISPFFIFLLLLCEVFVIYATFLFMFNVPLILFAHAGAFEAIKESAKLVLHNWWRTFFIFLVPLLVILVISMLAFTLSVIVKNIWIYHVATLLIATFITLPFMKALVLVQFNDLRLRSAGPSGS